MRVVRWGLIVLVTLAGCYLAAALALTFWPVALFQSAPPLAPAERAVLEQSQRDDRAQTFPFRVRRFVARDGVVLFARQFGTPGPSTLLLLHGVAADSAEMNQPAGLLNGATGLPVIALDLRGHGQSGGRPWSVNYAGQYEDDVADVLRALKTENPGGKLILAGHSMGGGIALRYAVNNKAPPVDGYLLLAPLLGPDAPTAATAPPDAEAARVAASLVTFRTPRFFGVLMLNLIGIKALNGLPILYFNQVGRTGYGFSALQGAQPNAPKGYCAALRAITVPLLVVAGSRDEAFRGDAYAVVVHRCSAGRSILFDGDTHNGVLRDRRAIDAIRSWLDASGLAPATPT